MIRLSIDLPIPEDIKKRQREERKARAKRNKELRKFADRWVSQDKFYLLGTSFGRITKYEIKDEKIEFWLQHIGIFQPDWKYREFWHNRSVQVYDHWTIIHERDLANLQEVKNPEECVKTLNDFLSRTADEYLRIVSRFETI